MSDALTRARATEIANLSTQVGDLALRAGAPAAVVLDSMEAVLNAFKIGQHSVDIAYSAVSVTVVLPSSTHSITVTKVSDTTSAANYSRLDSLDRLRRNLEASTAQPSLRRVRAEISRIAEGGHLYGPPTLYAAWGTLSAAVATTILASPVSAVASALATMLTVFVVKALTARNMPVFFRQLVGAFVSTAPIIGLYAIKDHLPFELNTSQALAAGIVSLLAGLSLLAGVQDVLMGAPVTGMSRVLMAGIATAGMIAGIAAAIQAATSLGLILPNLSVGTVAVQQLPAQVVAAAVAGGAAAIIGQARALGILLAAIVAPAGFATSAILQTHGVVALAGAIIAGSVVGLVSYALAKLGDLSVTSVVIPALTPLLPGLLLYRGMYRIIVTASPDGAPLVLSAMLVAFSLAAGSVLGSWIGSQIRPLRNIRPTRLHLQPAR